MVNITFHYTAYVSDRIYFYCEETSMWSTIGKIDQYGNQDNITCVFYALFNNQPQVLYDNGQPPLKFTSKTRQHLLDSLNIYV